MKVASNNHDTGHFTILVSKAFPISHFTAKITNVKKTTEKTGYNNVILQSLEKNSLKRPKLSFHQNSCFKEDFFCVQLLKNKRRNLKLVPNATVRAIRTLFINMCIHFVEKHQIKLIT